MAWVAPTGRPGRHLPTRRLPGTSQLVDQWRGASFVPTPPSASYVLVLVVDVAVRSVPEPMEEAACRAWSVTLGADAASCLIRGASASALLR